MSPPPPNLRVLDQIQVASLLMIREALHGLNLPLQNVAQHSILVVEHNGGHVVLLQRNRAAASAADESGFDIERKAKLSDSELDQLRTTREQLKQIDRIEGSQLPIAVAAFEIFDKQRPLASSADRYQLKVLSEGDAIVVLFADKERLDGTRGSAIPNRSFEVEFAASDLVVRRANFIR